MSNLVPEVRVDKNNVRTTRWVRPAGQSPASGSIPPPAIKVSDPHMTTIRSVLSQKLDEEQTEAFSAYLNRRLDDLKEMVANTLLNYTSDTEFNVIVRMINDHGHNPRLMKMMMYDFGFTVAVAEAMAPSVSMGSDRDYNSGLTAIESAFTLRFRSRQNELPEDFDVTKYGPTFRASAVTRMFEIDHNMPSIFDEMEQIKHVSENIETFKPHLATCYQAARTMNYNKELPTSHDLLKLCEMLDENPGSDAAVKAAILDRERVDFDELRTIASNPAPSLAEGAL